MARKAKKAAPKKAPAKARVRDVESVIDSLYAVSPTEFVHARNEAADSLRAANPEAAKRVRALARPSAAAWALNTLARTSPREVKEFLAAGDRVREATGLASRGGGAADLRTSAAAERRALLAAVEATTSFIEKAGIAVTETHRARIAGTLAAAVVDDTVRADLLRGRLSLDLQRVGFGETAPSAAAARPAVSRSTLRAAGDIRAMERDAEQRQRAREAARRLGAEADRAEADAARSQTRLTQAEREAERLERESKEAAQALADARKRLTAARKDSATATRAATSARAKAQQAIAKTR